MSVPFLPQSPSIIPEALADRPARELGLLYAAGRVVPRDLVAAHMWLSLIHI